MDDGTDRNIPREKKLISVAVLVVKFRGGSLLVTACSGCATRSNL